MVCVLPSTRTWTLTARVVGTAMAATTTIVVSTSVRLSRVTNPPSARGSSRRTAGLLTRGSLSLRLPSLAASGILGARASPLTAAGPSRIRTGVPPPSPRVPASLSRPLGGPPPPPPLAGPGRLGGGGLPPFLHPH